jgi:tripartite-type tricarboxylate transporter receptor subunit TctC
MGRSRRRFLHLAAGVAALAVGGRRAGAQTYPARPVRLIVTSAPGGQDDFIARLLAQKLSERLGQQLYVENIPGGGGNIGMARAAQAAPDGYTVLVVNSIVLVVNPALYAKVPYDLGKTFAPVTLATPTTQLLVHPSLAVATVRELVDRLKAEPGKYTYASPGIGSAGFMAGELFRLTLGLDMVQVPFGGAGPAIASTVAGQTLIAFASPAAAVPQVKAGTLRALAVASAARLPVLPELSTMAEAGFPDIACDVWETILVPADTPPQIIARLNREVAAVAALPDVKERLSAFGFQPSASPPEDAAATIQRESAKWTRVIRAAGIKAE